MATIISVKWFPAARLWGGTQSPDNPICVALGKAGAHGLLGEEVANSACALCLLHCFCQFLGAVKPCTLTFESGALTNEPIGG